ncbi:restriction endonuclease subunit S [Vibrio brasiliensis]
MVPNGWKSTRLNKIAETVTSGSRDWAQYYSESGSKFIRMTNLPRDGIYLKLDDLKYVNVHSNSSDGKRTSLKEGDLLISITAELGKIGWVPPALGEAYINQHTALVRIKKESADSKYIAYLLSSHAMNHKINRLNDSGAKAGLNLPTIRSIPMVLPPLPEQRKVAKILSTWDKAISTTEKLIETSKQQKKALMQQLLTGKKRLVKSTSSRSVREGFALSKIGDIPDDWEVELISKHYWYQEGPGVRKHQFTENGVKLFNGTNIQQSRIDLSNTSTYISSEEAYGSYSHFLADSGDLVIACSGISVERFDEKIAFINQTHLPLCMNTSTMRFKVKSETTACLTFMRYFMMSDLFKNQIRRQITGSAQLNFGPSHMAKCFIPLPPLEEQKKIASVLGCADKEVDILEAKLAHFKQEKKALMQQLLTGKRRVKVDNMEAA